MESAIQELKAYLINGSDELECNFKDGLAFTESCHGDCHGKKVTFRISEKKEFNFQSLPWKQEKNTLPVISAAKGWKSLK